MHLQLTFDSVAFGLCPLDQQDKLNGSASTLEPKTLPWLHLSEAMILPGRFLLHYHYWQRQVVKEKGQYMARFEESAYGAANPSKAKRKISNVEI